MPETDPEVVPAPLPQNPQNVVPETVHMKFPFLNRLLNKRKREHKPKTPKQVVKKQLLLLRLPTLKMAQKSLLSLRILLRVFLRVCFQM